MAIDPGCLKLICIENKPAKGCLHPAWTRVMHSASAKGATLPPCESTVFHNPYVPRKVKDLQAMICLRTIVRTLLLMIHCSTTYLILPHKGPLYGAVGLATLLCGPHRQCPTAV